MRHLSDCQSCTGQQSTCDQTLHSSSQSIEPLLWGSTSDSTTSHVFFPYPPKSQSTKILWEPDFHIMILRYTTFGLVMMWGVQWFCRITALSRIELTCPYLSKLEWTSSLNGLRELLMNASMTSSKTNSCFWKCGISPWSSCHLKPPTAIGLFHKAHLSWHFH